MNKTDWHESFLNEEEEPEFYNVDEKKERIEPMFELLSDHLGDRKYFGIDKVNIGDFMATAFFFSYPLNENGNPV